MFTSNTTTSTQISINCLMCGDIIAYHYPGGLTYSSDGTILNTAVFIQPCICDSCKETMIKSKKLFIKLCDNKFLE